MKCRFLRRGKTRSTRGKTSRSTVKNFGNIMASNLESIPGHIGGKASALTTAPVSQSFRTVNFLPGYVFNLLK